VTAGAERVLVLTPSGRDGELASALLARNGLQAEVCTDIKMLVAELPDAGCAIVTTEALDADALAQIRSVLQAQPAWSDFPFILFAPQRADRTTDALEAVEALGNVALLERPVKGRTLVSSVVAALRARRRQYEGREAILRRDQFLAMLGHELRNPLAAIRLAIESLDAIAGTVGEKQRRIIERQSRHLARLVDDLLDVARVTSGKVNLQRARVDLNEVIQRCVQGVELAARERAIQLRARIANEPLQIFGDLVRLEEVFNNLIGNALKYSPDGARVDVIARRDDHDCVVDVIDTGIGIEANMLERVFELFTQVEGTLARSQGGLGIGLTLVRSLVELHDGTVEVDSKGLGCGTRFTVRLPALAATAGSSPTKLALVPESQQLRIVLVEDNADVLELTKELLELLGHTVTCASTGRQAIVTILHDTPDLALIDIGLPEVDGYEVARQIHAQLEPRPFLVALTGYGQDIDRERAREAGFDAHLTKPISPDELAGTIAKLSRELLASERPSRFSS